MIAILNQSLEETGVPEGNHQYVYLGWETTTLPHADAAVANQGFTPALSRP